MIPTEETHPGLVLVRLDESLAFVTLEVVVVLMEFVVVILDVDDRGDGQETFVGFVGEFGVVFVGLDEGDEQFEVQSEELWVDLRENFGQVVLVGDGFENVVSLVVEDYGVGEDHGFAELVHLGFDCILVNFQLSFNIFLGLEFYGVVEEAHEIAYKVFRVHSRNNLVKIVFNLFWPISHGNEV